jgi:hypothetical protein
MFDTNVRTLAQGSAAANNWLWNFLVARFTPQMFAAMSYGVYLFFASLMICGFIFVYFLIPETKNMPLECIDRLFDRKLKARQAHAIVWEEEMQEEQALRVGLENGMDKQAGVHVERLETV